MRVVILSLCALMLALVLAAAAAAHGGEDGADELAQQPAKVLVQQAHALLLNGQEPEHAAVRLEAAELSKDKSGVDAELLGRGRQALAQGDVDLAIELLERALALPAVEKEAEASTEEQTEAMPAQEKKESSTETETESAAPATTSELVEPGEAGEPLEPTHEVDEDESLLESEEALEGIHGASETFRPDRSGQELAAGIGGAVLLAGAIGGLAWRFRRDMRR